MTFEELFTKFLTYKKKRVKKSTFQNYSFIVKSFLDKFKDKNLKSFTYSQIQNFFDEFACNHSNNYNKNFKNIIIAIFKFAVKFNFVKEEKLNIFSKLELIQKKESIEDLIKQKEEENIIITIQDLNNIFDKIKISEEEKFIYYFGLKTGMRLGEVLALSWEDINFSENFINVNKNFSKDRISKNYYLDTPKTKTSIRKIFISNELKDELIKYKELQEFNKKYLGSTYQKEKENFIFRLRIGKHITQDILQNSIRKIKNIFPCFHFHLLRHGFISQLVNSDINILYVSKIVGHSNSNITEKVYSHIKESKLQEIMLNAKIV